MAASQSLFSYLLSAELPEFRKNDGKIGDIKGKVEKTGKNSWIFGNYLTIFNVHAIISNCVDYVPRDFLCVQEEVPVLTELASREKVIGVKQSARAIRAGRARRVFLACDADRLLTDSIRSACGGLPVEEGYTMAQLGRACGIAVGAAVVAVLD